MAAHIGFFEEQQPNGKVARSWSRLTLTIPLLMAVVYLFFTLWEHHTQFDMMMAFLKAGIIDQGAFVALSATLKTPDYIILSSLLGITFGIKLFQKGQENKALGNEMKKEENNVENP